MHWYTKQQKIDLKCTGKASKTTSANRKKINLIYIKNVFRTPPAFLVQVIYNQEMCIMKKVIIYARIFTREQNVDMQITESEMCLILPV